MTWLVASMPVPFFNQVVRADLESEEVEACLSRIIDFYRKRKAPLRWVIGPGARPPTLGEALRSRGFLCLGESTAMWLDLDRVQASALPPDRFTVEVVETRETLAECLDPMSRGHSMSESAARFYLEALEGAGLANEEAPCRIYLGRQGGKPKALAVLFVGAGVGGVYSVATVPEARGTSSISKS